MCSLKVLRRFYEIRLLNALSDMKVKLETEEAENQLLRDQIKEERVSGFLK